MSLPACHGSLSTSTPEASVATGIDVEGLYEVILHNDQQHSMDFVVWCLVRVFGHTEALAVKIMLEAHRMGQAAADVEPERAAREHAGQLRAFGLTATVEKV